MCGRQVKAAISLKKNIELAIVSNSAQQAESNAF